MILLEDTYVLFGESGINISVLLKEYNNEPNVICYGDKTSNLSRVTVDVARKGTYADGNDYEEYCLSQENIDDISNGKIIFILDLIDLESFGLAIRLIKKHQIKIL